MQQAQRLASGALPELIKLGYPAEEIGQLADELRGHLPYAHARVADSLALITWYAMAVGRLADFPEEEIKTYVINRLCKIANDANSQADSLTDFLDKLNALHSESLVGEWSVRLVKESPIGPALAVNMSTVWSTLDKQFNPIYSRKVVESLIDKVGGRIKSVQKFHRSKDESLTYQRARVNSRTDSKDNIIPIPPPEMVSRRCVLIPAHLAQDFINSWRNPDNDPGGGGGGNAPAPTEILPVTPVISDSALVTENCNRQDAGSESVSDVSDIPVTYLEHKREEEISIQSDAACESAFQTDKDSLGHPSFPQNDVTEGVVEVETETETQLQRLHSSENSAATDATGCNRTTFVSQSPTPAGKELSQPQAGETAYRYQGDRPAYGCIHQKNGKSGVVTINAGDLVVLIEEAEYSNPELVYVRPLGVDWEEGIVVKREDLAEVLA
jgi:hypothetical protein